MFRVESLVRLTEAVPFFVVMTSVVSAPPRVNVWSDTVTVLASPVISKEAALRPLTPVELMFKSLSVVAETVSSSTPLPKLLMVSTERLETVSPDSSTRVPFIMMPVLDLFAVITSFTSCR